MNPHLSASFRAGAGRFGLLAVLFLIVTPAAWIRRILRPARLQLTAKGWTPASVTTRDPNTFYGQY